jgi:hypothetical protein
MKNRIILYVTAVLAALLLAGCQQEGLYTGSLIIEGAHHIQNGEKLAGAVLLLDGSLVLEEGAQVDGPVFMLGGSLESDGFIQGDVSVLGGDFTLGPTAVVGGSLNLGGGNVTRSPHAEIRGEVITGDGLQIPNQPASLIQDFQQQWQIILFQALGFAILSYLVVRYLPRPAARLSRAATRHYLVSAAMGLLVGMVSLVLVILMAFTVILIPISFIFGLVILAAVAGGWVGIAYSLGMWIIRTAKLDLRPSYAAALGGLIYIFLFGILSIIGGFGVIQLLLASLALGAVFLTRFGLTEFTPVEDNTAGEF